MRRGHSANCALGCILAAPQILSQAKTTSGSFWLSTSACDKPRAVVCKCKRLGPRLPNGVTISLQLKGHPAWQKREGLDMEEKLKGT
jgi:hypothetical protein